MGPLVPVRETGALLPQLATSAWIRRRPKRKWIWALASVGQGAAVLGIAGSAIWLDGARAGGDVLACLALLLVGSVFGWVAQLAGEAAVLGLFTAMCLGAAVLANGLEEVQAARGP